MDWHKRFVQQAAWTKEVRAYLFQCSGMHTARRVLEVGCGTGAILCDLPGRAGLHGLDLLPDRLLETRRHVPQAILACADALRLPYASGVFDITFCHFLLLWVHDPLQALREMNRVTRPGGSILVLAEPDYTRRVDWPPILAELGHWQTESLRQQGADPGVGGRLAGLFRQAGIPLVESGVLARSEAAHPSPAERALEWAVLEADLAGWLPASKVQLLKRLDERAWKTGERILYVPTHYAWGQSVPMV
jgi:SAM-dependent methyltransferase